MKQSNEKSREELDLELTQDLMVLKKHLKGLSKNQLITLVFDQMGRFMEQKQANEALLDKLGEKNENNS